MNKTLEVLKNEGVEVFFLPLEESGYALLKNKTIVVNENLKEDKQKKVILHELGHFKQTDYLTLYQNEIVHSKMEAEANEFMVESLVKEYIEENNLEKDQLNPVKLLEWTGLDAKYQEYVEQFLYAYCS